MTRDKLVRFQDEVRQGSGREALGSEEDFAADGQEGEQGQVKFGRLVGVMGIEMVIKRLQGDQLDPVVEVPEVDGA